jgi:hypothetical protein
MSAGGLSYSAITNYGRATLPSVEGGFGSMNILRDPPKSITTRRIDKVGQTSLVTDMVDESHTRACENIRQFALGINPFVSVSYSNEGNNGGQRSNGISNINQGRQAYLPYTIMKDGAFRPPVLRQEQLMPLSRQPRVWTQAITNPQFPDFSKKMRTCMENGREIRNNVLRVDARPTAIYNIEKPIEEPFEVRYVIQNPIHISGNSGIRTLDITEQNVQEPTKGINDYKMSAFANTNKTENKYVNLNEFDPSRYLQDTNNSSAFSNPSINAQVTFIDEITDMSSIKTKDKLNTNAFSNPSINAQVTSIDEIIDMSDVKTKDKMNITYLTQLSGNDRNNYIHDEIELNRRLPEYNAITNKGMNIHKQTKYDNQIILERNVPNYAAHTNTESKRDGGDSQISRQYRLNEKIFVGGMEGKAGVPTSERSTGVENAEIKRFNINKIATEMNMDRYRR